MASRVRDIGYRTEVRLEGEGPVVVLVHGTPLEQGSWAPLVALLSPYRRLVSYDLRGHGTAADEPLVASYDVLADDLRRLLDALPTQRAHVVGHSFGGQVAARFARQHPERLASLTTICSRWTPYAPFATAAAEIEAGRFTDVAAAATARWFTDQTLRRETDAVRYVRHAFEHAEQQTFATALRMLSTFDGPTGFESLDVPVHIIAAERDQVVTAPDLRAAAAGLRQGRFSLVPAANHMLPVENPDSVSELLLTELVNCHAPA